MGGGRGSAISVLMARYDDDDDEEEEEEEEEEERIYGMKYFNLILIIYT